MQMRLPPRRAEGFRASEGVEGVGFEGNYRCGAEEGFWGGFFEGEFGNRGDRAGNDTEARLWHVMDGGGF